MGSLQDDIRAAIRDIPDYPKKGMVFKDLTTLWKDGRLMRATTEALYQYASGMKLDKVVGVEARGFIVGAPLAEKLGIGFVPARKVGKLPSTKVSLDYELEYGRQAIEIHSDALTRGDRVLVVDDLLATGGTSSAAGKLVEQLGGVVEGFAFVAELSFLGGRKKLDGYEVYSLAAYDS